MYFLLQVNDVQVQGLSHSDASAILRKAEGTAKLVVGRPHDTSGFKSLRLPAAGNSGTRRMKTIQQEQTITLNKVFKEIILRALTRVRISVLSLTLNEV